MKPSVVLNKVAEGKGNFGYNAATGEFGDMIQMGILDPTKVTRTALQNAASIAGLMITTECMIADLPKKEETCSHGGGMGGGMGWNGWHGRYDVKTFYYFIFSFNNKNPRDNAGVFL